MKVEKRFRQPQPISLGEPLNSTPDSQSAIDGMLASPRTAGQISIWLRAFDGGLRSIEQLVACLASSLVSSMDRYQILPVCLTANKIKDFTIACCGPPLCGKHGGRSME